MAETADHEVQKTQERFKGKERIRGAKNQKQKGCKYFFG